MNLNPHLTQLLRQLQENLQSAQATVATAESCTGGLLAFLLTDLPGSSVVYAGGVSAYANAVKSRLLGVDAQLIARFGAVSAQVAEAMARGAQERIGTTYGLSLTGVAGPGGGSIDKPVGTVYCGLAGRRGVASVQLSCSGDRSQVRWAAAEQALRLLLEEIKISN